MIATRSVPRVMLLIDADNVTADVIEQALHHVLERHGAAHVRRAYCTAELAHKHLKLFKAHSIRPMVNISTGKNSTDIALAVDAMDLVLSERPDVAVLVSSDSDFAPLVIRLREKGCRVEGIGQEGKTGDDSKPVYDEFVDIAHRKGRTALAADEGVATRTPAARKAAAKAPATKRAAASSRGTARRGAAADRAAAAAADDDARPAGPARTAAPAPAPRAAAPAPSSRAGAPAPAPRAAAPASTPTTPAPAPAAAPARRTPARRTKASAAVTPAVEAEAAAAAPVAAAAPAPVSGNGLPDEVERILAALPELQLRRAGAAQPGQGTTARRRAAGAQRTVDQAVPQAPDAVRADAGEDAEQGAVPAADRSR